MRRINIGLAIIGLLLLVSSRSAFAVNEHGDPNCAVVDVLQANRLIDVDPGDQFWLTVPVASGFGGVEVHREGDKGWTWLKAGEFLLVQYDQPGEYTIRFRSARAARLAPFTVRVFAPPADAPQPHGHKGQAGAGGVQAMAAAGAPRFSLGSVYAGLYDEGATNKFPLRIVSYGAGDCVVIKAGGGWTNIYRFAAAGEQSDLVDVPAGQTWTLIKVGYGSHTLSTNTPGRLSVKDLILTNDLGHAPAPGSVANLLWHALTNETVTLQVMPGPFWVTNNPAAAASLFIWTTNSVALPATLNLTQTFTPAPVSNLVNVVCNSPAPASPTNQTTTIRTERIDGDSDDDGVIAEADRGVRSIHPIIVQRKLSKENAARTLVVRKLPIEGVAVRLVKTGNMQVVVKSKSDGSVLIPSDQTESTDIGALLAQSDHEVTVEGIENGSGTLALRIGSSESLSDPLPIRVLSVDLIFRNGNQTLADLIKTNVTHGGFDTGDGFVHDLGGNGTQTVTIENFYDPTQIATATKRRLCFKQANYMAGRIWEKLADNIADNRYDNPTGAKPWNLFTTADNYVTANCLEWVHKQWQRAIREVHSELQDPVQKSAFESAYYNGEVVYDLVVIDLIRTIQGPVGTAEAVVAAYILGANLKMIYEADKNIWDNSFEGSYVYFYPGFYGVPLDQVPWWVPGSLDLWSEGQLNTITPNSYLKSGFFEEVPY